MAPEFSHVQLEDGSIAVVLGDFIGTVSSWHLVPSKENQLRMLYEAAAGAGEPPQATTHGG